MPRQLTDDEIAWTEAFIGRTIVLLPGPPAPQIGGRSDARLPAPPVPPGLAKAVEEDEEGAIADPARYLAYFRKFTPGLVNGQLNFAVGVPPGKPEAVRLMFHRSRSGKSLVGLLKKELGACKVTSGIAGAAKLAEAMGDDPTNRTLVLDLEGRPIPALGKRVRIMLRRLKVPGFNKVKILVGGQEAEISDGTDDEDIAPLEVGDDAKGELGDQLQPEAAASMPGIEGPDATVAFMPAPGGGPGAPQLQVVPGTAPPPDTKALFAGLDAESQRLINAETDRIFYEKGYLPEDKRIASKSDPNAAIWLAIRDGVIIRMVSDPGNPARQAPPPAAGDEPQPQWSKHLDAAEEYFRNTLKLTEDEIGRLETFSHDNAMAEENGEEKGAARLIGALSGKSSLGPLRDEMKTALSYDFAMKWMYSPSFHEDGAEANLDAMTKYAKSDPDLAKKMAEVFRKTAFSVPNSRFDGTDYDVLEKERDIQASLFDHAIDLDPTGTVKGVADGQKLAAIMLGQVRVDWIPGSEWTGNPDRFGRDLPKPAEDRRNAVINAVARGALDPKEAGKFFDRVFNSSSDLDVSPVDSIFGKAFDYDTSSEAEQESMAKLLTHVTNQAHARTPEDEKFNAGNMTDIMKSKGGREVLFSTSMSNEYRLWALDMMSQDSSFPDKRPWTAADLSDGWESPVVGQAFAGKAVEQARENFPEPWKVNGTADRGMLGNVVGEMFRLKKADVPKDETEEQKRKRLDEGFNHPAYELDAKPMKEILGYIGNGESMVTAIPVSLMNREEGPAQFQVLRIQKDAKSPPAFVDDQGNRYGTADKWVSDNKLPPGKVTFPRDLDLANPLVTLETPKSGKGARLLDIADKAAMAVGAAAGVALMIGTGGAATPLVAAAAAAYSGTRAVQHLVEMHDLGHDVTDLGDSRVRGLYLDVATNAFAVGQVGSAKLLTALAGEGAQISRAGANLIAGLQWAGNITDAAALANQINDLAQAWRDMSEDARDKALVSLGFTIAMHGAAVAKGGGFREQFDVKRIRNQIENKTPFNVEKAKPGELKTGEKIAVRNENGKMTIVYEGAKPTGEMLALHSDAAVSMEASYTLRKKLKRMMGDADPDQAKPGSAAWEAVEEIKKIEAEADAILSKLGSADAKARQELIARQVELNEAVVRENAKLDHFDKAGKGYVAAPAKGKDQAAALGWDKAEKPEGYEWVAGDREPHLFAPGKEPLYYDPHQKKFISKAEKAKIEDAAREVGKNIGTFMKTSDPSGGRPDVKFEPDGKAGKGLNKAEFTQELADRLGKKPEEVGKLVGMMGRPLGKEVGLAWEAALANSKQAQEAMDKSTLRTKLAGAAERGGRTDHAAAMRKQAGKLNEEASDLVGGEFWKLVYGDKRFAKLKQQILDAGLTFQEGKAPYLEAPDPDNPGKTVKVQVTLKHPAGKTGVPVRAQDAESLELSFRSENAAVLEHIRRTVRNQTGTNTGDPHPMPPSDGPPLKAPEKWRTWPPPEEPPLSELPAEGVPAQWPTAPGDLEPEIAKHWTKASGPAREVLSKAAKAEPALTAAVESATEELGGKMIGLKYRVKGAASLTEKIATEMAAKGVTAERAAARMSDAVRYTASFPPEKLADGVKATLSKLQQKGNEVVLLKNTWLDEKSSYKGVNVQLRDPNGQPFEVQFHTPESFWAKDEGTHDIYKQMRKLDKSSPEWAKLNEQQMQIARGLTRPAGIERIKPVKEVK